MALKYLHKRARLNDKWLGLIFILPLFLLLSMSLVSAILETSNPIDLVKGEKLTFADKQIDYNILWDKYKPLQIESWYGLPLISSIVAEAYISEHTEICGTSCHSNIVIYLKRDGSLIDDVKFDNIVRGYQFYIKIGEKTVDDYGFVEAGIYLNGSVKFARQVIGNHQEPIWKTYNLGDVVSAGTYEIKLEGSKKPTREVDWQIKTNGIWTTDWATWGIGTEIVNIANYSLDVTNPNAHAIATNGSDFWITDQNGYAYHYYNNWTIANVSTPANFTVGGVPYGIATNNSNLYVTRSTDFVYIYNMLGVYSGTNWATQTDFGFGITMNNSNFWIAGNDVLERNNISSYTADGTFIKTFHAKEVAPNFLVGIAYYNGSIWVTNYVNSTVVKYYANGTYNSSWDAGLGVAGGIEGIAVNGSYVYIPYHNSDNVSVYMMGVGSSVTLNSPIDNYGSTTSSITFNCSATITGATLVNISLWDNSTGTFKVNQTNIVTGATNTTAFTNSFGEGSYLWSCGACDSDGDCGFATTNRTVSVDTIAPSINLIYPAVSENINYANGTQNLSWIITDTNFASAWYNYNGTNISVYGATNSTTFQLDGSDRSLTFWANDTAGNVASLDRSWNYTLFSNLINYSTSTTATSNETFTINLTYITANWLGASAVLNYNGTNYISTKTATTNNLIFSNSIIVPNALTPTNYNFFWNVSLTNATGTFYINTSSSSQLVNPLLPINITSLACGAGSSLAFNFTSLIESNLTEINFTTVNYNLQYGSSGNTSALVVNGTLNNVPVLNICINSTSEYYVGYGEIQYSVSGYSARRFYIFQNTRVTNTTVSNNLYSLETAISTPFQITATDTTLTAYVGYYIGLLRWYPDLNSYKVVDMGKTDALGQTVLNVKTNDVDYRLALYSPDGTLVRLLDPIRMVCQTTPCVYSLIVDLSGVDLTTFLNIQSSLTYDRTTKVFTYIFNDPSQDTTMMNLTVWQDFADKPSTIICSTTSSSFTGILVCDVSAYTGQIRAEVWRTGSPAILIAQLLEDVRTTLIDIAGGKTIVLFIGLILTITMALMGVVSPPLVIILSVIALIPLMFLGLFSVALLVLIGAIGGIILHMLRRIS